MDVERVLWVTKALSQFTADLSWDGWVVDNGATANTLCGSSRQYLAVSALNVAKATSIFRYTLRSPIRLIKVRTFYRSNDKQIVRCDESPKRCAIISTSLFQLNQLKAFHSEIHLVF